MCLLLPSLSLGTVEAARLGGSPPLSMGGDAGELLKYYVADMSEAA